MVKRVEFCPPSKDTRIIGFGGKIHNKINENPNRTNADE
jgi:hypothetical protein